jgi:hypothetical protein
VRPEHDELGIETNPAVHAESVSPRGTLDVSFSLLDASRKINLLT